MKNIKLIQKILGEKNKKKLIKKANLEEFVWDSMAMISLITLFKEKYKKNINVNKLRSLKTLEDLDNYLKSYLK